MKGFIAKWFPLLALCALLLCACSASAEGDAPVQTPPEATTEGSGPDGGGQQTDDAPYSPKSEAWTALEDGTILDAKLADVLRALQEKNLKATVYIAAKEAVRVEGVPVSFLKNVTFLPDPTVFEEAKDYEILVEAPGEDADVFVVQAHKTGDPMPEPAFPPKDEQNGATADAGQNGAVPETDQNGVTPGSDQNGATADAGQNGAAPETDQNGVTPGSDQNGATADAGQNGAAPETDPNGLTPDLDQNASTPETDQTSVTAEAGQTGAPAPEQTSAPSGPEEQPDTPAGQEQTAGQSGGGTRMLLGGTDTPEPEDGAGRTPVYALTVRPDGQAADGAWQDEPPVFLLGSEPPLAQPDAYAALTEDGRIILLRNRSTYVPPEGETVVSFVIVDELGDYISNVSETFTSRWDQMPPDGPYIVPQSESEAVIFAGDSLSGVEHISLDGGETWEPFDEQNGYRIEGEEDTVIYAGSVLARDRAGNVSALEENYSFREAKLELEMEDGPGMGGVGGGGSGGKTVRHVAETSDYSLANYNALDLTFSEEPVAQLVAGDTKLSLSLMAHEGEDVKTGLFTASLASWKVDEQDARETPNALVLSASGQSDVNTWTFSGETYRLLYNSGIDYLVFESNGYMTAVSTAGFTAGTAYAKLKAGGISTRKFYYTVNQDEGLRETTLSVSVEGETYLLGEERDQPMYRYDVLIGTMDMMEKPFMSYLSGADAMNGDSLQSEAAVQEGEPEQALSVNRQKSAAPGGQPAGFAGTTQKEELRNEAI